LIRVSLNFALSYVDVFLPQINSDL